MWRIWEPIQPRRSRQSSIRFGTPEATPDRAVSPPKGRGADEDESRNADRRLKTALQRLFFYFGCLVGGFWFLLCSALGIVWLLFSPGNRQTLYVFGRVFCR